MVSSDERRNLAGVLDVVGNIADLLHPDLDHLVLVVLFMCGHQESQHHLELILDESLISLDAKLQGHLLGKRRFGEAKCSAQHGLAHTLSGSAVASVALLSSLLCGWS